MAVLTDLLPPEALHQLKILQMFKVPHNENLVARCEQIIQLEKQLKTATKEPINEDDFDKQDVIINIEKKLKRLLKQPDNATLLTTEEREDLFKVSDSIKPTLMADHHRVCSLTNVKDLVDPNGASLLHMFIFYHNSTSHTQEKFNSLDILKKLIEAGVDINKDNAGGLSPLHYACRYGLLECAKLLIEAGANVNAKDKLGLSVIHSLLKCSDKMDMFNFTVDDVVGLIKLLKSKGHEVGVKSNHGESLQDYANIFWKKQDGFDKLKSVLIDD